MPQQGHPPIVIGFDWICLIHEAVSIEIRQGYTLIAMAYPNAGNAFAVRREETERLSPGVATINCLRLERRWAIEVPVILAAEEF